MESNEVCVGTLVENPTVPAWGPGKVVHLRGDTAHVFFRDFEDHRAKRFKADYLRIADVQSGPILDNLPPFVEKSGEFSLSSRRVTMDQAVAKFMGIYPGGFFDEGYLGDLKRGERSYKWKAHEMWLQAFGEGRAEEMLASGGIAEMNKHAMRIVTDVNLLTAEEGAAFKDGLSDKAAAEAYHRALVDLLASGPTSETFEPYAAAIASMPAIGAEGTDRWTVASILPFLARPDAFMFVKQAVTLKAAERLGFDPHFDARPNWTTYDAVLRMSRIYFELLDALEPRDLIDVQSFFWVTSGQAAKAKSKRPKKAASRA
jgi:hypothetical protein